MTFTEYLQQKDIAKSTIKTYQNQIQHFKNYLTENGTNAENATKKTILNYFQNAEEKRNISNRTKQHFLGILKHYYSFLNKTLNLPNPTHLIKIRGTKKQLLHNIFTSEELEQLSDLFYNENRQNPTLKNQQNYLILTLYIYQALKTNEIKQLTKNSFDLRKATVKIQATKKTNSRTLNLNASQIGSLMQYFTNEKTENLPLIKNNNQIQNLSKQLKKLQPKFNNFLQIRASVITNWIKLFGLRKAQIFAGHRFISSTEIYLKNDFEELQNQINQFHPF